MSHTVIGIFDTPSAAQQAVDALLSQGFTRESIDFSVNKINSDQFDYDSSHVHSEDESDNSIGSFFKNLFSDETEADKYTKIGQRGNVVSVYTRSEGEAQTASLILDQYGTVDVDQKADQYLSSKSSLTGNDFSSTDNNSINVIEEELQVGKREIETGSVKIRSRIVERPVEETLRLRKEKTWIERTPVNRAVTEADLANLREAVIEVKEYAEIPVISKDARVIEEIRIGKNVEEYQETIRDTVRKTEVDVEEGLKNTDNRQL